MRVFVSQPYPRNRCAGCGTLRAAHDDRGLCPDLYRPDNLDDARSELVAAIQSGDQARILTPSLTGALLPGVTRDSLLTVAHDLGIKAEEGRISVEEWKAGCASGEITEVFACGTAAVVTPVGEVKSRMGNWTVGSGGSGEVTMRLRQALLDIQTGSVPDRHAWLHKIVDA